MRTRRTDPRRIQAAREDAALTQAQVAEQLNVDRTAVAKWESPTAGKAPSPINFKALCDLFGCEPSDLLAEADDKAA